MAKLTGKARIRQLVQVAKAYKVMKSQAEARAGGQAGFALTGQSEDGLRAEEPRQKAEKAAKEKSNAALIDSTGEYQNERETSGVQGGERVDLALVSKAPHAGRAQQFDLFMPPGENKRQAYAVVSQFESGHA